MRVRDLHSAGEASQGYDRLILAPGASPIRLPLEGIEAANVFVLRNMEDTDAIRAWIDARGPRRAVIVGAGAIGLETAELLVGPGIQVERVELLVQVLPPLDPHMPAPVAVHLRLGTTRSVREGRPPMHVLRLPAFPDNLGPSSLGWKAGPTTC